MNIGFTGTRKGMTDSQKLMLRDLLPSQPEWQFHHGDCVGADADAHDIARIRGAFIIGHPPTNPKLRAFKECDLLRRSKPYILRNHDIVDETEWLIATPQEYAEIQCSGTWATVRYARKLKRRLSIIGPDGELL